MSERDGERRATFWSEKKATISDSAEPTTAKVYSLMSYSIHTIPVFLFGSFSVSLPTFFLYSL